MIRTNETGIMIPNITTKDAASYELRISYSPPDSNLTIWDVRDAAAGLYVYRKYEFPDI